MSRPGPRSVLFALLRRAATATSLVVACVAATIAAGWSVPASADTGVTESVIASRLADARAAAGVPALRRSGDLDAIARAWARRQADEGEMPHNPDLAEQAQPARSWYENVGSLTGVPDQRSYEAAGERLHELWMGSSGHRANVLRTPLTDVGIGVAVSGGQLYATVVFREQDGAAQAAPAPDPEPSPDPAPSPEPTVAPDVTVNSAPPPVEPATASTPEPAAGVEPEPDPDPVPEPAVEPDPSPEPTGPPVWIASELERHSGAGEGHEPPVRLAPPPPEALAVPDPVSIATRTPTASLPVREEGRPTLPVLVGLVTIAGAAAMSTAGARHRTR